MATRHCGIRVMESLHGALKGRAMSDPGYPEHDKLKAVKDESQKFGTFLEWLQRHYPICEFVSKEPGYGEDYYFRTFDSTEKILARYFGIDLNKLEQEKLQMLEEQRKLNRKHEKLPIDSES